MLPLCLSADFVNSLSAGVDKFQQPFLAWKFCEAHRFGTMQPELIADYSYDPRPDECLDQTNLFRTKFQNALRECIRHHFSVEEAFGIIWVEILEEVPLLPNEQASVYEEMIQWAKTCASRDLFCAAH